MGRRESRRRTGLPSANATPSIRILWHRPPPRDYVLLTHDLDFGATLAATNGAKPSVVQFRAGDLSADTIGQHLIDALRRMEADLKQGALLTIEPGRARMRLLPLRD